MILIIEIAAGVVLGFLITRLWSARPCVIPKYITDLLQKIEERPIVDDCSDYDRYKELLGYQFSEDKRELTKEEQLEFSALAKEEKDFWRSRVGDVKTGTLLVSINRNMKQELEDSLTNFREYLDMRLRESTTQHIKKD